MATSTLSKGIVGFSALLLAGGLLLVGCKEGNPLPDARITATPDFSAATPTAAIEYISIVKSGVTETRIVLDVAVSDVSEPVSGIALKVRYPNAIARFASCTDGDLLPLPGGCYASETAVGSGTVFVGRSIQAPQSPTPVVGTKVIVRLEFIVFAEGSGPIVFEAQNLGGGDTSALLDANGDPILVQWFAGNLCGRCESCECPPPQVGPL